MEQLHLHLPAVQIALVIQKVRLDHHGVVLQKRRPGADVGHRRVHLPPTADHGEIHAQGRLLHAGGHGQVECGHAQAPSHLPPVLDQAGDGVRPAQEPGCPLHVPLGDQAADVGRAGRHPVHLHILDAVVPHAQPGALLSHALAGAPALIPEPVVAAGDDMYRPQLLHQHLADKRAPRHAAHGLIKMGEDYLVHPAQAADLLPSPGGVDEHGHRPAGDHLAGVLVKGEHAGDGPRLPGAAFGHVHQALVADVDPVKKAQGDGPARALHAIAPFP